MYHMQTAYLAFHHFVGVLFNNRQKIDIITMCFLLKCNNLNINVYCCLLLFSSRSFHNLSMLLLSYFSCMLHFVTCTNVSLFLRLFFQFVSLIPFLLCNCLLMYFCLLVSFLLSFHCCYFVL